MSEILDVVDLGTKKGSAISNFLKKGPHYFGRLATGLNPKKCLGVDINPKWRRTVTRQGYQFAEKNLADEEELESLPVAKFYLAWDFLEHLPDHVWAEKVLLSMVDKSLHGVWVVIPNFDQDETGERALKKLGLRFAWTKWLGHPNHWTLHQVSRSLQKLPERCTWKIRPAKKINHTRHPDVVPLGAPVDSVKYSKEMGNKPLVALNPAVIGQWHIVVWKN